MELLDRINIIQIFKAHKNTLYDYAKYKKEKKKVVPLSDLFLFFVLPLLTSCIITLVLKLYITTEYLNIIITSLSIFVGLLFSLLTLVFDLIKKEKLITASENSSEIQKAKYLLLQELFINISFAIALSILTISSSLFTRFNPVVLKEFLLKLKIYYLLKPIYLISTNIISLFLSILFLLTLLMILKRFFIIFKIEIGEQI